MNDAQAEPAAPAAASPTSTAGPTGGGPPVRSPERYGRRAGGPRSRAHLAALVAFGLGASLVVALLAYANLSGPGISGTVTAFDTGAAGHVDISFDVTRDRPGDEGTCLVRARSVHGDEVGRAEVLIAPGRDTVKVTYRLATSGKAVTGEVFGCRYGPPSGQP